MSREFRFSRNKVGKRTGMVGLILLFAMLLCFVANAETTVIESGTCGASISWELDNLGTLTLFGSGPMENYDNEQAPWNDSREEIRSVIIEYGITSIGSSSFYRCSNLVNVKLNNTLTTIGDSAFYECTSLSSLEVPDEVSKIGKRAFYNCSSLKIMEPTKIHTNEVVLGVDAACEEEGLTEGLRCSVCGDVLVSQRIIPAFGHSIETIEEVPATCTKTGLTEGSYCSVCKETLTAQEEIPALGHDEGDWVIVIEATSEKEGLRERYCTVCGFVLASEVIPKLEEGVDRLPGDVNEDGDVDVTDLLILARYLVDLTDKINLSNADVDANNDVDVTDLLILARYVAEIPGVALK